MQPRRIILCSLVAIAVVALTSDIVPEEVAVEAALQYPVQDPDLAGCPHNPDLTSSDSFTAGKVCDMCKKAVNFLKAEATHDSIEKKINLMCQNNLGCAQVKWASAGSLCDKLQKSIKDGGSESVAADLETHSAESLCVLHDFCDATTEDFVMMENLRKRQYESANGAVMESTLAQTMLGKRGARRRRAPPTTSCKKGEMFKPGTAYPNLVCITAPKLCTCNNGEPSTGADCPSQAGSYDTCASCNEGYKLATQGAKACDPAPKEEETTESTEATEEDQLRRDCKEAQFLPSGSKEAEFKKSDKEKSCKASWRERGAVYKWLGA